MTPSEEVDEVWHQHLSLARLLGLVRAVLGGPLHHDPTAGNPEQDRYFRARYTTRWRHTNGSLLPPELCGQQPISGSPRGPRFARPRPMTIWRKIRRWYQTMPLNPLDWTAQPFLALYVAVAVAAVLLVLVLRRSVTTGPDRWHLNQFLTRSCCAWLTGGRTALHTVLVAFLECGVADQEGRRGRRGSI